MYNIENDDLLIAIHPKGAELNRIYFKKDQTERLWSGDAQYWDKKSPLLFPIVGTLKTNSYVYNNQSYQLSRHGFARDMSFDVSAQTDQSVSFQLKSQAATLANYPFHFILQITYTISANELQVEYSVENTGHEAMYFSIGGHPAFSTPLTADENYNDYYLEFSEIETAGRWPISNEGLIEALPVPLLQETNHLPLSKELFFKDALVFKHLRSESIQLKSSRSAHGLEFNFKGFPFLGIWAAKNADFICIEPWCGIADSVTSDQQLQKKEGIQMITPRQIFTKAWSVRFF